MYKAPLGVRQILASAEGFYSTQKNNPPVCFADSPADACICLTPKGAFGLCGFLLNHVNLRSDITLIYQFSLEVRTIRLLCVKGAVSRMAD